MEEISIKTFEDACNELGNEHPYVMEFRKIHEIDKTDFNISNSVLAFLKLRIICAALNCKYECKETANIHYKPIFKLNVSDYFCAKNMQPKNYHVIPENYIDFTMASDFDLYSYLDFPICLTLNNPKSAKYCGTQFISIWSDYLFF